MANPLCAHVSVHFFSYLCYGFFLHSTYSVTAKIDGMLSLRNMNVLSLNHKILILEHIQLISYPHNLFTENKF